MKIQTSVLVGSLSGAAGDVVAGNWKGRLYARRRVIPANPQSAGQTLQRNAFARCVDCFQHLPADIAAKKTGFLDKLGSDEALSGYNIMMRASIKTERDSHGHCIVPANRYAPPLNGFAAEVGATAEGDIDITWDVDDWLATDVGDVFYREKEAEGDEYKVPWIQDDTAALDMSTGAFTIEGLTPDTDFMIAMVPYNTVEEAFGGGAFANATSKAGA